MIDINKVKSEAEAEVRDEQTKAAKERLKSLLRKKETAKQVLANIDRELNDTLAELGQGITS